MQATGAGCSATRIWRPASVMVLFLGIFAIRCRATGCPVAPSLPWRRCSGVFGGEKLADAVPCGPAADIVDGRRSFLLGSRPDVPPAAAAAQSVEHRHRHVRGLAEIARLLPLDSPLPAVPISGASGSSPADAVGDRLWLLGLLGQQCHSKSAGRQGEQTSPRTVITAISIPRSAWACRGSRCCLCCW